MAKKKEKTAGQHLDHAIEKTKQGAKKSKAFVSKHATRLKKIPRKEKRTGESIWSPFSKTAQLIVLLLILLVILIFFFWPGGGENATTEQAQSIATMLAEEGIPFRNIQVKSGGYVITYAAEDAVDRFDEALIHDWGMIYGTAAAHDCQHVTIVTTLADEAFHRQQVECEAVRAFVRGVFTEAEFQALIEHEALG